MLNWRMPIHRMSISLLSSSVFFALIVPSIAGEGLVSHVGGEIPNSDCISEGERNTVDQARAWLNLVHVFEARNAVLLADPVGRGGTNSPGLPTNNYVDLGPSSVLLDFSCRDVTYNGHGGTDIDLTSFFDMDEGVPVLAAAPGVVSYSHDGEFDRNTSVVSGAVANAVIVDHADGSSAYYWHFRKNSVRVAVSDVVEEGDTLGYAGSSGLSTAPHLHFEIRASTGEVLEPYEGACQTRASMWQTQKDHILDVPFVLMSHGVTTLLPLTWAMVLENPPSKTHVTAPGHICSWFTHSSGHSTDQMRWEIWANGSLWTTFPFQMGQEVRHGWWYGEWYLPDGPEYYGNWVIRIFYNNEQVAEQQFQYDAVLNQTPIVTPSVIEDVCGEYTSEFSGYDPDGSIFSYGFAGGPWHGTLTTFGGYNRKFTYFPAEGFVGRDSVWVFARDDENAVGDYASMVFVVDCPCCTGRVGDANLDGVYPGEITLADIMLMVDALFISGNCGLLPCPSEADVNQSGGADPICEDHVTLADIMYLVDFLFIAGPENLTLPDCL